MQIISGCQKTQKHRQFSRNERILSEEKHQWGGPGRVSTQRLAVPHVIGTGPAQVGPLQEQVGEAVQAEAGGERADEAIEAPQGDAQGPGEDQQDHEPDDGPETGTTRGHPRLGEEEEGTSWRI